MTLEWWNNFFQIASAVLLGLTFAVGLGAAWTGSRVNKRQAERLAIVATQAAEANAQAANAYARAAEANLKAEEERLARVKIEQRLAPRSLIPSQKNALLAALQTAGSKGPVEVSSPTGDGEARDFARELLEVLRAAGWPLASEEIFAELVTGVGVHIVVRDLTAPPVFAATQRQALSNAGIQCDMWAEPQSIPAGTVRLAVTTKPQ